MAHDPARSCNVILSGVKNLWIISGSIPKGNARDVSLRST
jgi:hypothetical protein